MKNKRSAILKPKNIVRDMNNKFGNPVDISRCCYQMANLASYKSKQEQSLLDGGGNAPSKNLVQPKRATQDGLTRRVKDRINNKKVLLLVGTIGAAFFALSSAIFAINPISVIINSRLTISDGSFMYNIWKKPPITIYFKVYVFNVTNGKEFMSGSEKINLTEIGPFVYIESLENFEAKFHKNHTLSYKPVRTLKFVPEMSTKTPLNSRIIVPNLPLIGLGSMLANSSMFLNLAYLTIANIYDSQPLLNLTIEEYFWGYDDPLVKAASKVAPSWINFERFGLVERMVAEGDNTFSMNLNDKATIDNVTKDVIQPLTLESMNGSPGLKHLGYRAGDVTTHKMCNRLRGVASDGVIFRRNIKKGEDIIMYRKAFCRTLKLEYDREGIHKSHLPAYWYKLPPDVFNNDIPENSCYCKPQEGPCLARGLSDMTPCYYSIPTAVSQPHFFNADPKLVTAVNGLSPDKEKHNSYFVLQPEYGIPLEVKFKIQMNIVVKKTRYNKRVIPFNNLILPVFWFELCVNELPSDLMSLINLLYFIGPVAQRAAITLFALSGAAMLLLSIGKYMISLNISRKREHELDLWGRL